jgi:hypothetical protein
MWPDRVRWLRHFELRAALWAQQLPGTFLATYRCRTQPAAIRTIGVKCQLLERAVVF